MTKETIDVGAYLRNGKLVKSHTKTVDKKTDLLMAGSAVAVGAGTMNFISAKGKEVIHVPSNGTTYSSFAALMPKIRPGDVLVTGEHKNMTFARFAIGLGTGNAEVYHTSVVDKVTPTHIECLDFTPAGFHRTRYDSKGRVLYPRMATESGLSGFINGSTRNISVIRGNDPALVTKALNNHRLRAEALNGLLGGLISRGVGREEALKIVRGTFSHDAFGQQAVDELFTPFFKPTDHKDVSRIVVDAEKAVKKLHANSDKYAAIIATRVRNGHPASDIIPKQIRGVCSTAAAVSGFPVSGNKSPTRASPLDAMRSTDVHAVGHFRPNGGGKVLKLQLAALRVAPYAVRAAVGGAIGYGAYRAGKALLGEEKTASYIKSAVTTLEDALRGSLFRTTQVATPEQWTALGNTGRKVGGLLLYGVSSTENKNIPESTQLSKNSQQQLRELLRSKRMVGYSSGITE